MLHSTVDEHTEHWPDFLPYLQQAFNASVHESTKCTPNRLMLGTENRLPPDIVFAGGILERPVSQCACEYAE